MKKLLTIAVFLLAGCASRQTVDYQTVDYRTWEPTSLQKSQAAQVTKTYAVDHLGLTTADLDKMVLQFAGGFQNGKMILRVDFFDPAYHEPLPDIGLYETVRGGFPTYFSITVEPETWMVIAHYACEE